MNGDADLITAGDGMAAISVGNDVAKETLAEHSRSEVPEVLGELFGEEKDVRFETFDFLNS